MTDISADNTDTFNVSTDDLVDSVLTYATTTAAQTSNSAEFNHSTWQSAAPLPSPSYTIGLSETDSSFLYPMSGIGIYQPSQQQSQHVTTIGQTFGYNSDSKQSKCIELRMLDGTKLVGKFVLDLIHNVTEKKITLFKYVFSWKWPFIKRQTTVKPYVEFSYGKANSPNFKPNKYQVDCNLETFAKILGIEYVSFDEAVLETAIEGH